MSLLMIALVLAGLLRLQKLLVQPRVLAPRLAQLPLRMRQLGAQQVDGATGVLVALAV